MGVRAEQDHRPLVLLVDDDPDLLDLAEMVLDNAGLRVITARNGRSALAALEVLEPDVIVTDLMMPELDGLELIQQYTAGRVEHAPIVAVSGFLPYLEKARELGAAATMAKPYNPKALASLIFDLTPGKPVRAGAVEPPPREDEEARLRAVLDLRLEEPEPELGLQKFLDEVAEIFQVPVAGVSAVTSDRQRFVAQCSRAGAPDAGIPRDQSFCTHAIAARSALVIQDALNNPFFRDNPNVTERAFRFYAGVPLMSADGHAVGTLCLMDFKPHQFTYVDLELLGVFAQRVLAAFEWRDKRRYKDVPDSAYRYLQCVDEHLGIYGKGVFGDLVVLEASRAMQKEEPAALVALAVKPECVEEAAEALRDEVPGGLVGRLGRARLGAVVRGKTAEDAREMVARCARGALDIIATDLDQYEGATGRALLEVEQALGRAG
jgi:CheY-like chemotaxis protein